MKKISKLAVFAVCLSVMGAQLSVGASVVSAESWGSGAVTEAELEKDGKVFDDKGMFDELAPLPYEIRIYRGDTSADGYAFMVYTVGTDLTFQQLSFDNGMLYYTTVNDTDAVISYLNREYPDYTFEVKTENGGFVFESTDADLTFTRKLEIAAGIYEEFGLRAVAGAFESVTSIPVSDLQSGSFTEKDLLDGGKVMDDKGLLSTLAPKDTAYEVSIYTSAGSGNSEPFMVYTADGIKIFQQVYINYESLTYVDAKADIDAVEKYLSDNYSEYGFTKNEGKSYVEFVPQTKPGAEDMMTLMIGLYDKYGIRPQLGLYESTMSLPAQKGDINVDGKVNITDVTMAAAHVKNIKSLDETTSLFADVNGDGIVNITDVTMIASHTKGIKSLAAL